MQTCALAGKGQACKAACLMRHAQPAEMDCSPCAYGCSGQTEQRQEKIVQFIFLCVAVAKVIERQPNTEKVASIAPNGHHACRCTISKERSHNASYSGFIQVIRSNAKLQDDVLLVNA